VGGYRDLAKYTTLGGALFVFAVPDANDSSATTMR
jgi:lanthanide-dependent methanol dehydrogenase